MLIVLDPHSGIPVYRQLMEQIKFHVASGLMKSGDELPSTRILSSTLGLNPMTVSKAYGFLEKEGVIEHRPGLPAVVRGVPAEELGARRRAKLQESLLPTVTVVRQLGISRQEALDTFRLLLENHDGRPPEDAP